MTFTRHGHHISGTVLITNSNAPERKVARCGGPGLCKECSQDAARYRPIVKTFEKDGIEWDMDANLPMYTRDYLKIEDPLHLTTQYESNVNWQDLARQIVFDWVYEGLSERLNNPAFSKDEVYVVWYCFILGGWKALISTTLPDGRYYEVTYNTNKSEVYLDTYRKTHNQAINIIPNKEN